MPVTSSSRTITVRGFSAARYYALCASAGGTAGATADAYQAFSLALPESGTVEEREDLSALSLLWIENAVAQSQRVTNFLDSVRNGEIPEPLLAQHEIRCDMRLQHTSPALLAHEARTILSALNLKAPLLQLFLTSPSLSCPGCGEPCQSFRSASELVRDIRSDHIANDISISLTSTSATLTDWAARAGFTCELSSNGHQRVLIDSLHAGEQLASRVVQLIQSAWNIPHLIVSVSSAVRETIYAPHGACQRCRHDLPPIYRKRIDELLVNGPTSGTAGYVERGINVAGVTLEALLCTPIAQLSLASPLRDIISEELQQDLCTIGLGVYPLGYSAAKIPPQELASLSVLASFSRAAPLDTTLIDLPHEIFTQERSKNMRNIITRRSKRNGTLIIGDALRKPLQTTGVSVNSIPALTLGTLRIKESAPDHSPGLTIGLGDYYYDPGVANISTREILLALEGAPEGSQVSFETQHKLSPCSIELFSYYGNIRKLVIEELALFEPLTKLFASSLDARIRGLHAKDLSIRSKKRPSASCPTCFAAGVILEKIPGCERPAALPCYTCIGMRFSAPASEVLFRGLSLSEILNSSASQITGVLSALPKTRQVLELLTLLDLNQINLGMPIALLSFSEHRRLQLLKSALLGTLSRPAICIIEYPYAGLSEQHSRAVHELIETRTYAPYTAWIVLTKPSDKALQIN